MTRPILTWEEQDAFTRWRHVMRWRPGQIKRIKRRSHKRERQQAKQERMCEDYYPEEWPELAEKPEDRTDQGDNSLDGYWLLQRYDAMYFSLHDGDMP